MSALDAATVRAVYATVSTYRQSPNPARMAEFDAWLDEIRAEAWGEAYEQGIQDERTSEDNIGIAGLGGKVGPCRRNPYRAKGDLS